MWRGFPDSPACKLEWSPVKVETVGGGWGLGMTHTSRHGIFSSKIFIVSYKQSISAQQQRQQPSTQTKTQTFICSMFCRYKVRGAARWLPEKERKVPIAHFRCSHCVEGGESGQRCRDLVTEFRWKMDIGQSGDTEDQRNTWGQRRQWLLFSHLQLNCLCWIVIMP